MRVFANPFERFSEIPFGLIMAVSFTGALRVAERVPRFICAVRSPADWNRTIARAGTSRLISVKWGLARLKAMSVNP